MNTAQKDQCTTHPRIRKVMSCFVTTALTVIMAAGLGILLQPATAQAAASTPYDGLPANDSSVVGEVGTPITISCSFNNNNPSADYNGYYWNYRWDADHPGITTGEFDITYDGFNATITGTPTAQGNARLYINFYKRVKRDGIYYVEGPWYQNCVNLTVNPASSISGGTGGNTTAGTTTSSSLTSNMAKTSTSKTATAAVTLTPEQQAQMWVEYQAFLAQMRAAETASAHQHDYEWVETKQTTENDNGECAYKCKICGDVLYRVPTNAMGVFVQNTINNIVKAPQGGTVVIETSRWYSFPKSVFDALAARPDLTLTVNYLSEGFKGDPMTFTIPAGTDVSTLPDENGFAGFTFLGGIFNATPR